MAALLLQFSIPALSVLFGLISLMVAMVDQRKFRADRRRTFTSSPTALRAEALVRAQQAAEYDLPESAALWYQLEAFWNRCVDDEPAPLEIEIVGAGPKHKPEVRPLVTREPDPPFPEPEFEVDAFVARASRRGLCRACVQPSKYAICPSCWGRQKRASDTVTATMRRQWQLKGTDEDAYVLEALLKHGVKVDREGTTAHLVGTVSAVQAAEAEYRAGWAARRGKRR